jgi:hypothetical protein
LRISKSEGLKEIPEELKKGMLLEEREWNQNL